MSSPFLVSDLAKALKAKQPSTITFGSGEVAAVNTGPASVDVTFGGATIPDLPYLDSYSPTVGDRVVIARMGVGWFVMGAFAV